MDAQEEIPCGRRVRLIFDYIVPNKFTEMQVRDAISENKTEFVIYQIDARNPNVVIPVHTEGTVGISIYCLDIYDYEVECPVEWDFHKLGIAQFQGTPWKLFEFID